MLFKYRLAEILLKLVLNTNHAINQINPTKQINQSINQSNNAYCGFFFNCCWRAQSDISNESENTLLQD